MTVDVILSDEIIEVSLLEEIISVSLNEQEEAINVVFSEEIIEIQIEETNSIVEVNITEEPIDVIFYKYQTPANIAEDISVDTDSFNNILSHEDNTVQKALNKIDDLELFSGDYDDLENIPDLSLKADKNGNSEEDFSVNDIKQSGLFYIGGKVQSLNPIKFGAKGDGVTDDSQAFSDMYNYASQNGITRIEIPDGVYIHNSQVMVDGINGLLIEANKKAIIKKGSSFPSDGYLLAFRFSNDINIRNLEFLGITTSTTEYNWGDHALGLFSTDRITLENMVFRDIGDHAIIVSTSNSDPQYSDSHNITFKNLYFDNVGQISTTSLKGGGESFYVNGLTIESKGTLKFASRHAGSANLILDGLIIKDSLETGLEVVGYSDVSINNPNIANCGAYAINIYSNGDAPTAFDCENIKIRGGVIDNAALGIRISNAAVLDSTIGKLKNIDVDGVSFQNINSEASQSSVITLNGTAIDNANIRNLTVGNCNVDKNILVSLTGTEADGTLPNHINIDNNKFINCESNYDIYCINPVVGGEKIKSVRLGRNESNGSNTFFSVNNVDNIVIDNGNICDTSGSIGEITNCNNVHVKSNVLEALGSGLNIYSNCTNVYLDENYIKADTSFALRIGVDCTNVNEKNNTIIGTKTYLCTVNSQSLDNKVDKVSGERLINASEISKVGYLTVASAKNLDTMASDIASLVSSMSGSFSGSSSQDFSTKNLSVTGNITITGTVDGVDISGVIDQSVKTTASPTFVNINAVNPSSVGLINVEGYQNSTGGSGFTAKKARGTSTIPLATVSGDGLLYFDGFGHSGNDFARGGLIVLQADSTPASGDTYIPSSWYFRCATNATDYPSNILTISSAQRVGINGTGLSALSVINKALTSDAVIIAKGMTGQVGHLLSCQDVNGTVLASVSASGLITGTNISSNFIKHGTTTRYSFSLPTIAINGGAKAYTLTMPATNSGGSIRFSYKYLVAGTPSNFGSQDVIYDFYLSGNSLTKTRTVLAQRGAYTANVIDSLVAVGSGNQMTLTITNNESTTGNSLGYGYAKIEIDINSTGAVTVS